jgi:hypothetical protein
MQIKAGARGREHGWMAGRGVTDGRSDTASRPVGRTAAKRRTRRDGIRLAGPAVGCFERSGGDSRVGGQKAAGSLAYGSLSRAFSERCEVGQALQRNVVGRRQRDEAPLFETRHGAADGLDG